MEGCLVLDLSVWEAEGSGQLRPGRFSPTCLKFGQAEPNPAPPLFIPWSCGLYFKSGPQGAEWGMRTADKPHGIDFMGSVQ